MGTTTAHSIAPEHGMLAGLGENMNLDGKYQRMTSWIDCGRLVKYLSRERVAYMSANSAMKMLILPREMVKCFF
jgi:uncharacterized protein YifN (PemK superfamily)